MKPLLIFTAITENRNYRTQSQPINYTHSVQLRYISTSEAMQLRGTFIAIKVQCRSRGSSALQIRCIYSSPRSQQRAISVRHAAFTSRFRSIAYEEVCHA